MKKILTLGIVIFLSLLSYAQVKDTIHLDEGGKKISAHEFSKKAKSSLFFIANINTDSAFYRKLRYKEYFGKLNLKKKNQLNKLFQVRFQIDTTKIWLIHYKDSLPDVKKMPKKSGFIVIDSSGKELSQILSWNHYFSIYRRRKLNKNRNSPLYKHVTNYEDFKKRIDFEKNYLGNQKDFELLHFYHINKGYPLKNDGYNWIQDSSQILKKSFTLGMEMYKIIVLHPNGNFYVIAYGDSLDLQKKMINFNSFKRAKRKWLRKYERFN